MSFRAMMYVRYVAQTRYFSPSSWSRSTGGMSQSRVWAWWSKTLCWDRRRIPCFGEKSYCRRDVWRKCCALAWSIWQPLPWCTNNCEVYTRWRNGWGWRGHLWPVDWSGDFGDWTPPSFQNQQVNLKWRLDWCIHSEDTSINNIQVQAEPFLRGFGFDFR